MGTTILGELSLSLSRDWCLCLERATRRDDSLQRVLSLKSSRRVQVYGYHRLQYHRTSHSNPQPTDDVHFPHISVSTINISLIPNFTLCLICCVLTTIYNDALSGSCKALTHYKESMCFNTYTYICKLVSYIAVRTMGVGCGWACPTARPKWVWGVGTPQWAGIGARGRVILESVIFVQVVGSSSST